MSDITFGEIPDEVWDDYQEHWNELRHACLRLRDWCEINLGVMRYQGDAYWMGYALGAIEFENEDELEYDLRKGFEAGRKAREEMKGGKE